MDKLKKPPKRRIWMDELKTYGMTAELAEFFARVQKPSYWNRSVCGYSSLCNDFKRHPTMKPHTATLYKTWHWLDEARSRGIVPRVECEHLGLLEANGIVLQ